jgi:hypothetical protein
MTPDQYLQWASLAETLVGLGVRSFSVMKSALSDAGVAADDAAIAGLETAWSGLVADIARAAGVPDPSRP